MFFGTDRLGEEGVDAGGSTAEILTIAMKEVENFEIFMGHPPLSREFKMNMKGKSSCRFWILFNYFS